MTDRHDKEMYKSVTVRFSYVDENMMANIMKWS